MKKMIGLLTILGGSIAFAMPAIACPTHVGVGCPTFALTAADDGSSTAQNPNQDMAQAQDPNAQANMGDQADNSDYDNGAMNNNSDADNDGSDDGDSN